MVRSHKRFYKMRNSSCAESSSLSPSACYESKTKLFTLSEVPIFEIFSDESSKGGQISDHMRSVMDDLVRYFFLIVLSLGLLKLMVNDIGPIG